MGESKPWKHDLRVLGGILGVSTLALFTALYFLVVTALSESEWASIRAPTSLEAVQQLEDALRHFSARAPLRLIVAHMCCYLYLQSFAIPGTVFFNLLGGALFGMSIGFPLCLLYNTLGSVFMYLLSQRFGYRVMEHYFPERLVALRERLDGHRHNLALYMIFLRVFPFSPNWFINMAAPHLHIPLGQFTIGPLIGLIPYNFLSCQAGLILSQLRSKGDIIDTTTTVQLIVVAVVGAVVLPWLKNQFGGETSNKAAATKQD